MTSTAYILLYLTSIILSGCGPAEIPASSDTANPSRTTESPQAVESPSDTPEPVTPAVVLAADETILDANFLSSLSHQLQEQGFALNIQSSLDSSALPSGIQYLLTTSTSDLLSVQNDLPDLPILSLSAVHGENENTQHLLYTNAYHQRAAFLAGYTSAFLTPDYRTGYVDLVGSEISGLFDAYGNGNTYYCGHCSPQYPPYIDYPAYVQLSEPYTSEKISAVLSTLQQESVTTVYLHPFIHSEELNQSLKDAGLKLIGNQLLIVETNPLFDLIIGPDSSAVTEEILPALTQGVIPEPLSPPAGVLINSGWISDGRMQHLDEIIKMLNEGSILPVE
ncbi:MAG: hypothetical protein JXA25_16670 [Anaerolineales bacterium]|nr:hypothetical protein [Anaerolineales bacterium]